MVTDSTAGVTIPVGMNVPAGATIIVNYVTTDNDAFPFTIRDSQNNSWTADQTAGTTGIRAAQFSAIGITHALTAGPDFISVDATGTDNPGATRSAVAVAFSGLAGVDSCVSNANSTGSLHPNVSIAASSTLKRLLIGGAGIYAAADATIGFCQASATPSPMTPMPSSSAPESCTGGGSPVFQYPTPQPTLVPAGTPTPNGPTGIYAEPRAGTTTSGFDRQVNVTWVIESDGTARTLDGHLFTIGSTTPPGDKRWTFPACAYRGAVQ